jgi:hypothetical protein
MTPAQPLNVLLVSLTPIIEIVGAMLTWTCYLPAVIAISLPPALPLVGLLLLHRHWRLRARRFAGRFDAARGAASLNKVWSPTSKICIQSTPIRSLWKQSPSLFRAARQFRLLPERRAGFRRRQRIKQDGRRMESGLLYDCQ